MSRLIGLAITGLAVYLAINSLPDFSSRDSHMTAVAIATDNREGIAADLKNMAEPARSFSAANPLLSQPKTAQAPDALPSRKIARNPFRTVATGSATGADGQKLSGRNIELAALDNNTDIQPVLIRAAQLAPPKFENILIETQRELQRVGCYRARIDGIWGKGSRWALRRFVIKSKRIPLARKDSFNGVASANLLEYLRITSTKVCGKPCASGKMLGARGRCINDPVITASLVPSHSWTADVKVDKKQASKKRIVKTTPAPSATIKTASLDPGHDIQAKKITRKKAKRRAAKRKWRKKRNALGGPRARKLKRHSSRRKARRYRKWRKYRRNAWKRRALFPED